MLKKSGTRFLLHIILLVVLILGVALISNFVNEVGGSLPLFYALLSVSVIWTIHQLRWDILSFKDGFCSFLYGFLGIIMIIGSFVLALLGTIAAFSFNGQDVFAFSSLVAPFATFIFALLSEGDAWDEKIAPFMTLILIVGSIIVGILAALIGIVGGIILLLAGLITSIILLKNGYFELTNGLGHTSSSPSYSGSSNNTSTRSSSRGSLQGEMEYVANSYSVYSHYIDCGAYLYPNVTVSISSGRVNFTISGRIQLESGREYTSSEISDINFYTDRKLSELSNEIVREAQERIRELVSQNVDCSNANSINVRIGNIYRE